MRLGYRLYLLVPTEVVLLIKLGGNEVLPPDLIPFLENKRHCVSAAAFVFKRFSLFLRGFF
jgi:hypothetical protein